MPLSIFMSRQIPLVDFSEPPVLYVALSTVSTWLYSPLYTQKYVPGILSFSYALFSYGFSYFPSSLFLVMGVPLAARHNNETTNFVLVVTGT